jgi:hypothetical protein
MHNLFCGAGSARQSEIVLASVQSYLRELPSPLFGEELYAEWLEAGNLPVSISSIVDHKIRHFF